MKAVTAKLLMYGVGREIDDFDAPAIRGIMRAAAADNYRWSSTILAMVKSTPFQMRRTAALKRIGDATKAKPQSGEGTAGPGGGGGAPPRLKK